MTKAPGRAVRAGPPETPGGRVAAAAWLTALLVACVLLAAVRYESRDPDSAIYAGIAARLSEEPRDRWMAPEWWGHWGLHGLFREHPAGIFLLPAALARAGYPASQASYAVNAGFQVLSLVLLIALARRVVPGREAWALGWLVQLALIAFVFRIRANQEYAVLAGVLAALFATERSRERPIWALLTAVAFAWVLLVKGIFGLMVPALCALWLAVREGLPWARDRVRLGLLARGGFGGAWLALGATLFVLPVGTAGYEVLYQHITGESFLAFYAGPRLDADAVASGVLRRWPLNVAWYTGRLIWYALPWSAFALGACLLWRRANGASSIAPAARDGLAFVGLASALLVAAFAMADRRADRFIFPAYFFVAAAGAVAAIRWSPRLDRLVTALDRPWVPAAVWLALFLLRLVSGEHLPRPTWR